MSAVLLAGVSRDVREVIVDALDGLDETLVERSSDEVDLSEERDVDLFILGTSVENPIRTAQRISADSGKPGVLIVVAADRAENFDRELRYTPLLSADVRWVRADDYGKIADHVRTMAVKARRRRRFSTVLGRLREKSLAPATENRRTLYLDALLDSAPVGILLLDEAGVVADLNPAARRLLGDADSPARGRAFAALLPQSAGEWIGRVLSKGRMQGPSVSARFAWQPSGTASPSGAPEVSQRHVEITVASLSGGQDGAGAMIVLRDVTSDVQIEQAKWELREQRAVSQALEDRADELRRLNRELESRNAELRQFAYVASHDLQEPLRKIASFADLLVADVSDRLGEDGRFYVDRMRAAALRMSELIHGLLRFSQVRTEASESRPVALNKVLEDVMADLSLSIEETGASIEVGELPIVYGDESQLWQVFQNLVSNGIKFRKKGEKPRIRVHAREHPAEDDERAGHWVTVTDNGIGFDASYTERIFTPFQRLHTGDEYPGTGMGLAICARIAERHGGRFEVESEPGKGSSFSVFLPTGGSAPDDEA